jgi:hypothetical protein
MRVYLKCALFGLLAMMIATALTFLGLSVWAFSMMLGAEATEINFDPISWLGSSIVPWIILVMGFTVGFFWKLKSAKSST